MIARAGHGLSRRVGAVSLWSAVLLLGAATAVGCGLRAKKPVLYPNDLLLRVGKERAAADIQACTELAYQYTEAHPGGQIASRAATGAAVGGATGAVGGAILGRPGRGAAMGAAMGGTRAVARGLFTKRDPPPLVKRFVARCLRQRGYEPLGWQ